MLSRELMGLGALAILWINTLLIAGAAWKELARILAKKRALEALGVVKGRVVKGAGAGDVFAVHRIEQTGHGNGEAPDRKAILFHDKSFASEVFGGAVEVEGKEIEIAPEPKAEVWVAIDALREAGKFPGDAAFDEAFVTAKRAKGYARTVSATIAKGADVWIAKDGSFVSTIAPRTLLNKYALLALVSIVGFFAAVTACTVLALQAPHFGTVSIIGGVLGLAYFITVQPAGTMLRDAVRLPNTAYLRGDWIRKVRANESETVLDKPAAAETAPGE